ncbi:NAD(P)/FAD-dependent oxidoreductase [Rhodococcus sp. H29-C3]|uniref:NAD(P)/FAD-dependent oxidoreductase n=1 Tax=Rhodococcus sp. H29-C3 TaxID=3046307 RepID=UPI0024BA852E|nr:NAD(P)/FAD-dependent oxidoreductase [Rhodococcus sp. H29-C3]MDJ0363295.1 NAD(P)/FAD-dependent oxidoreductase [Rhodococcus sp. H29-C3]
MNAYDAIVIGGSAAGLSGATVLARALRKVLVIDAAQPRNLPASYLHGYLSRDGMAPNALLAAGREELLSYGGEMKETKVNSLVQESSGAGFVVQCVDGTTIGTKTILAATGLRDELPEVDGLSEQWGLGVLHCPYCHGYEVRTTAVAVLGGENRPFTMHQVLLIRQWANDVVFFPNEIVLTEPERERLIAFGIRIIEGRIARVVSAQGRVRGIELADGRIEARETIFVGPRFIPNDELLKGVECAVGENGWVTVDPAGQTSVPGVWAAGNVVDSPAQLINAAGAGSRAAIAINHYLLEQDVQHALAATRTLAGNRTIAESASGQPLK